MQITNIKSDVYFLCGATSATYLDADLIRNLNIAYQDIARTIWESDGGWQFDDSNATTLPIAKTTLVDSQQDYSLPTTAQRVEEVAIKDSAGNYQKLRPFDIHDTALAPEEYLGTAGMPIYYDVIGSSLMLYPKPSSGYVTLASGLAVYIQRDVTEFATSATTQTPGFATPFHRILSYAVALDFEQDASKRQYLAVQKARLEDGLKRFYSKRGTEITTNIKPASRKSWRQFI